MKLWGGGVKHDSKIETETGMSVGGTHTALLCSAGPTLTGGLPPVCLKSPRKGQIKVRAKGYNVASTRSMAAMHLTEYICEERKNNKTHHAGSLGCYRSLSATLPFSAVS